MIKSVRLGKEIVVTVSNKIGVLANMSNVLSKANINIEAVAGYADDGEAKIMLITNNNALTTEELKKSGYSLIKERGVIMADLENKVGALKSITEKLAAGNINIKYIYGATCLKGCPARMVISTSENEKALEFLKK